jgi:hypothetical protein
MTNDRAGPARDWVGSFRTYGLAWGIPLIGMFVGLFVDVQLRVAIWSLALAWMGSACLINARRCGRTHCRYTGPYYLLAIAPVVGFGWWSGAISTYGWLVLGAVILAGGKLIWYGTERAWGKFS